VGNTAVVEDNTLGDPSDGRQQQTLLAKEPPKGAWFHAVGLRYSVRWSVLFNRQTPLGRQGLVPGIAYRERGRLGRVNVP